MQDDPAQSAYFDTRLQHDPRRAAVWSHITRYLAPFVPNDASVLELGAGYCYFINHVPATRRVAVDIAPEMMKWKAENVEGHVGDAVAFLGQVPDQQFDFILASNFLEHFEWSDLRTIVEGFHRALRPGGRLALIQPNFRLNPNRYFDDYTHRTIFTDVSLVDWLEASRFTVIRNEPRFLPLTVKSRMSGLAFLVPLYLKLPFRPFAGQMFVLAEKA
jgi:SAM-dependent methyltransferase